MDIPKLISVDDHVIEPPDLFERHLPAKFRDRAPHVERVKGKIAPIVGRHVFVPDDDGYWADCWIYEDLVWPIVGGLAAVSFDRDDLDGHAITYDDMLPGHYERGARLHDMDLNHVEASLCFPTFSRFCGQTFLEAPDRELALACVEAYNTWMIDEWCADDARGRLVPLTLVPLWDPELAAAEVRRCAAKGSHAICFSESPPALGLPSVHGDHWDPLWEACEETDTVVNMHIGSSSVFRGTSADAPFLVIVGLTFEGAAEALVDWLCSGVLERFERLRIVLSEGQVGWMPFVLDRLDSIWVKARGFGGVRERVPRPPSSYVPGRVFGCVFEDPVGLELREQVGMNQIMFETDYPHSDSTWPESKHTATLMVEKAGLSVDETYKLLRGNAISCYRLDRYGIER